MDKQFTFQNIFSRKYIHRKKKYIWIKDAYVNSN